MYLLAVVAALMPETVSVYSSQTSTALHVGTPDACEEGLGTAYGPPVKVIGPLLSVSVPLGGVIVAKLRTASRAETETSAQATITRGLKKADWEAGFFFMRMIEFDYADNCFPYEILFGGRKDDGFQSLASAF
jgi:hypothetical protein